MNKIGIKFLLFCFGKVFSSHVAFEFTCNFVQRFSGCQETVKLLKILNRWPTCSEVELKIMQQI